LLIADMNLIYFIINILLIIKKYEFTDHSS